MVSSVKAATSLGRSGLQDWIIQRISAVVLAVYSLYIFYFLLTIPSFSFQLWQALFQNEFFRVMSLLALVSLLLHAWIGLWTVSTDYIKPPAIRFLFQSLLILFCLSCLIWGVQILWGL